MHGVLAGPSSQQYSAQHFWERGNVSSAKDQSPWAQDE